MLDGIHTNAQWLSTLLRSNDSFQKSNKTSLIACVHRSHHSTHPALFLMPQGIFGGWWIWVLNHRNNRVVLDLSDTWELWSSFFAHLLSHSSRKWMARCAYIILSIASLCCRHTQTLLLVLMALSKSPPRSHNAFTFTLYGIQLTNAILLVEARTLRAPVCSFRPVPV